MHRLKTAFMAYESDEIYLQETVALILKQALARGANR